VENSDNGLNPSLPSSLTAPAEHPDEIFPEGPRSRIGYFVLSFGFPLSW